ncbi:hypothetical protein T440DRAFT_520345 [Plenodomus tracheiphilus IPT5]|uniref:RNA polymerase III RPC4-domain-containing protein n=1 Tax=Plenodomus tracheiphilus IPT5 TaxID=1408161 RepID=A0A6A7AZC4_9PLEO|nr:hypothetical protein T440DRAFT_520345 [Plenodomus tracheiphilus IPT5]
MPPKASRGRGSSRARGAGRGGAAAARPAATTGDATNDATPQSTDATAPIDAPAEPVVPKQEDSDDAKVPVTEDEVARAAEAQAHADASSSTADATESSLRPPVQRLGSLQGSVPPSRSASPSVRGRGSATRGKRGMVKPTFTGRRTKEEREALAKELKEREELRNAERNAAEQKKERDRKFKEKRDLNKLQRARGGYSGVASGPFSLGSSKEDRKNTPNRGPSGYGGGSGSRAVRVKNEGDSGGGSGSGSGSRSGAGGGAPSIKREDGGYVSSEEEDDAEFPRRDIDLIEISSDENEDNGTVAPSKRGTRTTLPVRIGRKEHQERTVGINTDASSETAAKILEKAESTGEISAKAVSETASRKGKGKAKDVEITGERKPFRGVWQDTDDSEVAVKTETISEDEAMADAEQAGLSERPPQPAEKQEPVSPNAERKAKTRAKGVAEPILQTDEDRAEWARFQSNLQSIRAELGPEEVPAVDASGDTQMADSAADAKKPSVRDNNVYLFQIPPLMPELLPPTFKAEPTDETPSTAVVAPAAPATIPASGNSETKIKLEEGGFSDPSARTHDGPRFASGMVGKLRVRASGRTTLDWGGTSYELTPGNKASFLQEVVSINIVPEETRVVPEDAGDAVSMGRVKGKFVIVPDWGNMLG